MFAIPVKIVEVGGSGGGDLPLMTWNPSDFYLNDPDPANYLFSNTNETIEGYGVSVRGNYPIVPDRWYLEMHVDLSISDTLYENVLLGVSTDTFTLNTLYSHLTSTWLVSRKSSSPGVTFDVIEYGPPVVYAFNDSALRLLSTDGIDFLETLHDGDVFQFAGRLSTGELWIGLNGNWLYSGIEDADVIIWSLGDPETETNPVFTNLAADLYAFSLGGDDGTGGQWVEQITLMTHVDDLLYSPPTGFFAVSGDAVLTYHHVLRDRNLLPISQPTQHTLLGALGL